MEIPVAAKSHIDIIYFKSDTFSFHCIFIKLFCFWVCYFLCLSVSFFFFFAQFTHVCVICKSSWPLIVFVLTYTWTCVKSFSIVFVLLYFVFLFVYFWSNSLFVILFLQLLWLFTVLWFFTFLFCLEVC